MRIGCEESYAVPCARLDSVIHRLDKRRPAVGIDSMVAGMVCQHDILEFVVLRHACCYGEHDPVAEGNDGGAHVLLVVIAFGNSVCALEQRGSEEVLDKRQSDDHMRYAEALAVESGKMDFAVVVVAAVVEGHRQGYALAVLIEEGSRVQSAGIYYQTIFH